MENGASPPELSGLPGSPDWEKMVGHSHGWPLTKKDVEEEAKHWFFFNFSTFPPMQSANAGKKN